MTGMRVGVIDVGSNTVRLLVASVDHDTVAAIREERAYLGLGAELLVHGRVRRRKLDEVAEVTGTYAQIARKLGVRELEVVVTAPGRQGDPGRLLERIGLATAAEVRVVSAEEEGRLAFAGAVSRTDPVDGVVGVCDVGGGSTEVVVGTRLIGPAWVRSVDVGSLRLTAAALPSDPPTRSEIELARNVVREAFAAIQPPQPEVALATGGSARAVAKIVGREYGVEEIERVVRLLAERPARDSAAQLGLRPERVRTLLAGALLLAEVSRQLGVPFSPTRGGIREGAAIQVARTRIAA
jgi:exopolyphosphatase / guanosine-5'-triphosphate,3'-diphosphate pyrophosphatase